MNKILIYGMGGAREAYEVLEYYCIFDPENYPNLIDEIWRIASRLKVKDPSVERFFIMHDRRGLRRDFQDSIRGNSIESFAIFKDILEREAREIHL